jgi:hypothetical protein
VLLVVAAARPALRRTLLRLVAISPRSPSATSATSATRHSRIVTTPAKTWTLAFGSRLARPRFTLFGITRSGFIPCGFIPSGIARVPLDVIPDTAI